MHFEDHRYVYIQEVQSNPRFISSNQGKYASQCIAFSFFQFKIEIVWETFEYIWWRNRSDEIQTRKIYQAMKKVRTISFHRFCFCFQFKKREKRFFGNIFCKLKKRPKRKSGTFFFWDFYFSIKDAFSKSSIFLVHRIRKMRRNNANWIFKYVNKDSQIIITKNCL